VTYEKESVNKYKLADDEGVLSDVTYTEEEIDQVIETGLHKVSKNKGWFDLYDCFENKLNSKSLREDDIDAIIGEGNFKKEPVELFNIIDSNGKQVNEQALSEEEADTYIKSLEG
jgi:hypothetical protein